MLLRAVRLENPGAGGMSRRLRGHGFDCRASSQTEVMITRWLCLSGGKLGALRLARCDFSTMASPSRALPAKDADHSATGLQQCDVRHSSLHGEAAAPALPEGHDAEGAVEGPARRAALAEPSEGAGPRAHRGIGWQTDRPPPVPKLRQLSSSPVCSLPFLPRLTNSTLAFLDFQLCPTTSSAAPDVVYRVP